MYMYICVHIYIYIYMYTHILYYFSVEVNIRNHLCKPPLVSFSIIFRSFSIIFRVTFHHFSIIFHCFPSFFVLLAQSLLRQPGLSEIFLHQRRNTNMSFSVFFFIYPVFRRVSTSISKFNSVLFVDIMYVFVTFCFYFIVLLPFYYFVFI